MRSRPALLVMILLVLVLCVHVRGQDGVVVQTDQGQVRGMKQSNGQNGYSFLGVPYGKPPIDKLRFMPPQSPDSYGVLDATMSKICPQMDPIEGFRGQEDCLTLDIYTKQPPPLPTQSNPVLSPVLVYLPGGKFRYGASSTFKPENIFVHGMKNSVVVVVNYRLGVLGFLSTEDDVVPGNMGLLDQSMALQWISRNIRKFGGDPHKVLLFGHDSGAVSVGLHLVSKKSPGLFQSAAMFGGAIENPWAFRHQQARRHAETFASRLHCPTTNSRQMLECLQDPKRNVKEFIEQQNEFKNITFLPLVDKNYTNDPFLEDKPMEIIRQNQVANKVPMIFGMTANEGSIDFYERLSTAQREMLPRSAMSVYLKNYIFPKTVFGDWLNPDEDRAMENVIKGAHFLYFREKQSLDWTNTKPNWTEMISDYYYRGGLVNMARMWAQNINEYTYLYSLEHQSAMSYGKLQPSSNDYGVAHMDDIFYYFDTTYRFPDSAKHDTAADAIRRSLVNMLLEMAEIGKITTYVFNNMGNVKQNTYARITSETFNNREKIIPEFLDRIDSRMDFWTYFIPDILNNTDNYRHVNTVHEGYASATWGLVTMVVILVIVCITLVAVIVVTRRNARFLKVPSKHGENVEMKGKV